MYTVIVKNIERAYIIEGGIYMSKINQKLEDLTSRILVNNDMYNIPVDPVKIAKTYDILVYEGNLNNKIAGAIRYYKDEDKFEILVNKNDPKTKQRFTIAEELGYYILYEEKLKENEIHINLIDKEINEEEKEVEYFAGALLINKTLLENVYNSSSTILELSELFKVSVSSMTVRLDILGML